MNAPKGFLAAVARPGDTVIIGLTDVLTDEEHQALVEQWAPIREELGIKIALMEGVSSIVIARPEEES